MSDIDLRAADPGRRAALAHVLESAGHAITPGAALVLADLGPGEPAPDDATLLAVLTDGPTRDADAVLPRDAGPAMIEAALRAVAAGLTVRPRLSPARAGFGEDPLPRALLTPRELDILAAIGDGLSNKEAARRLEISAHTVKFHLEAVFAKLDVRTRAEAVAKGLRSGLIEL